MFLLLLFSQLMILITAQSQELVQQSAVSGYEQLHAPARNLSVKYRPKNVSVSISPSGEILKGSSVTLTCSVDANPPVETYVWFKETTSVGKGKTYIISRISTEDRGEYKCKCNNEVGHQYSDSVTLSVVDAKSEVQTVVIAVIITSLLLLSLVLTVLLFRRKNMFCWSEEQIGTHEHHIAVQHATSDASQDNQEEIPYANIAYSRNSKGSVSSNPVLYASVCHRCDEGEEHHQEEEVQYPTVQISSSNSYIHGCLSTYMSGLHISVNWIVWPFYLVTIAFLLEFYASVHRPEAETAEQSSVIYSSVK